MKNYFLSLFIASVLFFLISVLPKDFFLPAVAAGTLLLGAGIFRFFGKMEALFFLLISLIYVLVFPLEHVNTLYMQVGMGAFALYFLWDGWEKLLNVKEKLWKRVLYGVLLFIAMIGVGIVMNIILNLIGFNDTAKAIQVVDELPIYLLVVAFTIVPVVEELFFRALLIPAFGKYTNIWIGAVISSVFFGITHAAYGSVVEMMGATLLGMVLAFYFVRKGDILPCIIAHALYNFMSIFAIKMLF